MPSPLRLLFVSHSFPPTNRPLANTGGMQRVATELFDVLGDHPSVALSSHILRTTWRATQLRMPGFLVRGLWRISRAVRRDGIDVVLFSSMVTAALAPLLRLRQTSRDVAFVAIAHGRDVTLPFHPYQLWLRRALPRLNAVIAVSEATRDECVRRGAAEERVHVIPNGVAPERFSSMVPRAVARRLVEELVASRGLTIPQESVLLASVGRHVIRKGFGWFVGEVMPLLPDRYVYLLAGDGPQSRLIKKQVVHRSLESRVHLLGKLSDDALKTLYRGSDLFILPNIPVAGDLEGFGVVMLEAGMSGTPVIAAHVDGVPSVICEGENGVLVASGDAGAFAEAIECSVNGRGALNIRNRAEGYIRESFAWPVIVERYVALLQAVSTAFRAG